ncbi:hypothetical protein AB0F03_36975 [Streptomyces sp. NPDC028722]|uniref:hypothetical protein n=1 Tax=Streptomyces sp. NPDC028722 TaxID=3155016 RepID=UPI0033D554AD
MKAHSGDLLAAGRITSEHIHQLPDAEEALIESLAPHALSLTEGFAVLEGVMGDHPMLSAPAPAAEMVPA